MLLTSVRFRSFAMRGQQQWTINACLSRSLSPLRRPSPRCTASSRPVSVRWGRLILSCNDVLPTMQLDRRCALFAAASCGVATLCCGDSTFAHRLCSVHSTAASALADIPHHPQPLWVQARLARASFWILRRCCSRTFSRPAFRSRRLLARPAIRPANLLQTSLRVALSLGFASFAEILVPNGVAAPLPFMDNRAPSCAPAFESSW